MPVLRSFGIATAALALLGATVPAEAFTLGRARATAVLGRPLQLTIPITLDAEETELCASAELFQGDTRTGPVEVLLDRARDGSHVLRLRSTAVIEEPVVNVYLKVGCAQQSTRSYAFLTEQIYDQAAPPLALAPSLALNPPTVAPAAPPPAPSGEPLRLSVEPRLPQTLPTSPARVAAQPVAQPAPPPVAAAPAASPAPPKPRAVKAPEKRAQAAPSAKPPVRPAESKPRLRLEAAQAPPKPAAVLKAAPALAPAAAASAASAPERAEAAVAWKALNATQEEQIARLKKAEALEAEVKALREAMQRHTSSLNTLADQLDKVRGERDVASTILAVFAAGMALGLGFMLWLRSRESTRDEARWREMAAIYGRVDQEAHGRGALAAQNVMDVDSDWSGMDSAAGAPPSEAPASSTGGRSKPVGLGPLPEFAQSEMGASRLPKAEELLDIKQRTDFFLMIGEQDRAIELLEAQIHDHLGTSPVVWLDLLDICHRSGRREDYERIRAEYQEVFKARLPAFEANRPNSGGLEDHPRALSRIVLLWPSPRVLKVMEESLFENLATANAVSFDLEASRDLLMLYGIARDVVRQRQEEGAEDDSSIPGFHSNSVPSKLLETTEPIPLAAIDEEAEDEYEPLDADVDLTAVGSQLPPLPAVGPADPPTSPIEDFQYDFETKSRRSVL